MKNSLNSYFISGTAWQYNEPMQKINDLKKRKKTQQGVVWYPLTSCKHVLILNLILVFFFTHSLHKCFHVCIHLHAYLMSIFVSSCQWSISNWSLSLAVFSRISPDFSTFSTLIFLLIQLQREVLNPLLLFSVPDLRNHFLHINTQQIGSPRSFLNKMWKRNKNA